MAGTCRDSRVVTRRLIFWRRKLRESNSNPSSFSQQSVFCVFLSLEEMRSEIETTYLFQTRIITFFRCLSQQGLFFLARLAFNCDGTPRLSLPLNLSLSPLARLALSTRFTGTPSIFRPAPWAPIPLSPGSAGRCSSPYCRHFGPLPPLAPGRLRLRAPSGGGLLGTLPGRPSISRGMSAFLDFYTRLKLRFGNILCRRNVQPHVVPGYIRRVVSVD